MNISKIYWIYSYCNEPDLFCGSESIWVVKIVLHNVMHGFFHLRVSYMAL